MKKQWVHWQEVDISCGTLPLALLRRAVEQAAVPHRRLQNIGLRREGDRVLLMLCFGNRKPEERKWEK